MGPKVKGSCIANVMLVGNIIEKQIIHFEGGIVGEIDLWMEEIVNASLDINDVFYGYEQPGDKPGVYVWEGELEYVHDDQPIFRGVWREATIDDLKTLL